MIVFNRLLRGLVESVAEPEYHLGRPQLSLRDALFCAVQKVYSQLSSRRAHSLYKNAAKEELIGKAPHFNAVSKLLNKEEITPILHKLIAISASPLRSVETEFAVDSTGFRTNCFGRYAEEKHSLKKQHRWLKVHMASGTKTNIVTSVRITKENAGDSPQFRPLITETSKIGFEVKEVSADKAYSSRDNYKAVAELGGNAYIPFRKNATGRSRGSLIWKKMFHYFQFNNEEFMEHYHKRSNAETVFSMLKRKLGVKLKTKKCISQMNEVLLKCLAHNIIVLIHEMFELGIEVDLNYCAGKVFAQK
jgi:transposase